ncbi:hypothetical protein [Croceibacterium aestuarii]|uniref:hypothetical protein n=1 Tax=Croceibacterium aestuarii TaxID=3064139 RepID=UPI00272E05ED|nr:hypothetical protein [Croceibacterium sp. D39]
MNRLLALPVLLLTLPAAMCDTPEPGIEVRTVTKVVEVQKPCPGTVPVRPAPLGKLPTDLAALAAALGAKLAEYAGEGQYADQAQAYFETCSKVVNEP